MALGTQRIVVVSVLGLSLVALGIDRFVLSAEGEAAASAKDLLIASKEAVNRVADMANSLLKPDAPAAPVVAKDVAAVADLAKSLRQLGVDRSVLESLPESFAVAAPAPPPARTEAPVVAEAPIGEPPLVSAVLIGQTPRAIVAGKPLRVGATSDGWKLVAVAKGKATFEKEGRRFERNVSRLPDLATVMTREEVEP